MISVVLPTYNGQRYISQSIESVIHQTEKNWELVVVDDGSTDNTSAIVQDYADRDSRIRLVKNDKNMNLPNSLNKGFSHSRGEYLTWTSDDNYYHADALFKMREYLAENNGVPMVCAGMRFIDTDDREQRKSSFFLDKEIFLGDYVGACFMYRRQVLEEIGGYDPQKFCVEDYDYWLRIYHKYKEIGYIPDCLYTYRMQPNSLTFTRRREIIRKAAYLMAEYKDYVISHYKDDKTYLMRYYLAISDVDDGESFKAQFSCLIPELKYEKLPKKDECIVIYGAGENGSKLYEEIGDQCVCFADGDSSKWGKKKGVDVVSPEKAIAMSRNYPIVIAVSRQNTYDVMHMLYENGARNYCTYQNYMNYLGVVY